MVYVYTFHVLFLSLGSGHGVPCLPSGCISLARSESIQHAVFNIIINRPITPPPRWLLERAGVKADPSYQPLFRYTGYVQNRQSPGNCWAPRPLTPGVLGTTTSGSSTQLRALYSSIRHKANEQKLQQKTKIACRSEPFSEMWRISKRLGSNLIQDYFDLDSGYTPTKPGYIRHVILMQNIASKIIYSTMVYQ